MSEERIGIICALNYERVIGKDNQLPWHYAADLKRFKRMTTGQTIIMGRRTWDSLPKRPLAKRQNIVVTSTPIVGIQCANSITNALDMAEHDVWLIGGAGIFEEGLGYANLLDLTWVPDEVEGENLVYFPDFDINDWELTHEEPLEGNEELIHQQFKRIIHQEEEPSMRNSLKIVH